MELNPIGGGGQIDGAEIKDGKFTVRTNEGEKLVKVTAKRKIGETPATDRMPAEAIYHQYIPEKFNQASELKKTVSGGELLELALEGEELKPGAESASEAARRKAQGGGGP